jgi:hypothetical protein
VIWGRKRGDLGGALGALFSAQCLPLFRIRPIKIMAYVDFAIDPIRNTFLLLLEPLSFIISNRAVAELVRWA